MRNTVLASLEPEDGAQCVDFARADGTFGIEQTRAELDGASRWHCLNSYSELAFASSQGAPHVAKQHLPWLDQHEVWRW